MSESIQLALVCMPWCTPTKPSIQLGTIHAVAQQAGFRVRSFYFNLEFLDWMIGRADSADIKHGIIRLSQKSETLTASHHRCFELPELFGDGAIEGSSVLARNLQKSAACQFEDEAAVEFIRSLMPEFIQNCLNTLMNQRPTAVGFSCTFSRLLQLHMARILKERDPDLRVIFGGSQMEGVMGNALAQAFPFIDVVVRGEGEAVLPQLLMELCKGQAPSQQPGLIFRVNGKLKACEEAAPARELLKSLPPPNYDDYFRLLEDSRLLKGSWLSRDDIELPVETSRGCWWFKHKCKFCGRSEDNLKFRLKSFDQIRDEIIGLADRYGVIRFFCVDACVDENLIAKLADDFESRGFSMQMWCEGRVGIQAGTMQRIAKLSPTMFIGVECLSTPVLTLMRKGCTALEAIRTLRYGAEAGVRVTYNLIYGFPFEEEKHYERMTELLPRLVHLPPPFHLIPMSMGRDAVYFDEAEQYGIKLIPATAEQSIVGSYAHVLGASDETIADLALGVQADYQRINASVIDRTKAAVAQWIQGYPNNRDALYARRGPGLLLLFDSRGGRNLSYRLKRPADVIYLACSGGATIEEILAKWDQHDGEIPLREDLEHLLAELVSSELLYEEAGRYLALALLPSVLSRANKVKRSLRRDSLTGR